MFRRHRSGKTSKIHKESIRLFLLIAKRLGYEFNSADSESDMQEHWDYCLHREGKTRQVEVKGLKSIDRNSNIRTSEIITIEFQAVRYRNTTERIGWIFGKADLIAFQTNTGFIFIARDKLAQRAEELVPNWKTDYLISPRSGKKLYQSYTRLDDDGVTPRCDRFANIKREDINDLVVAKWSALPSEINKAKEVWNV